MAQYRWYKNGRPIVKSKDMERVQVSDVTKEYFDDHIGHQTHYEGNLDLNQTDITDLGKLETVSGSLELSYSAITSLGNLKSVGGYIGLTGINLTSLGKLESVGFKVFCTANTPTHELFMNSKFKDRIW